MLLAFTIVSVGVSSTTLMQSSSQLVFLWGVLVGCGTGMTAIVLGAAVAHRWFHFAEAVSALKTGLRSRDFWLLSGSFFICGASTNGLIGTHLVPACMDHGMPEVRAAGLLAMMGAFDLIGTTASGWLSDRFSNRWLLFTYYGLRGVSLLFLPGAFAETHRLSIFAVFYGLDWIATVPPTVALTAKSFGRERVTLMFGWIIAAHQVGAALAAWGAGWVRTTEGAYDRAFLLSGGLCVLTAGAVLLIGRGKSSRALGTSGAPSPADSPSAAVT